MLARMSDSLDRLYDAVMAARSADPATSRTARLLRAGRGKVTKKLAEGGVEVVTAAVHAHAEAGVREGAVLLYTPVVVWPPPGVRPKVVGAERARRGRLRGIAEKLPKQRADHPARRKVVALD